MGAAGEVLDELGDGLGVTPGSVGCVLYYIHIYIYMYEQKTCYFAISMPFCSGMATLAGRGDQVGAT